MQLCILSAKLLVQYKDCVAFTVVMLAANDLELKDCIQELPGKFGGVGLGQVVNQIPISLLFSQHSSQQQAADS